jgi:hypothetical protein
MDFMAWRSMILGTDDLMRCQRLGINSIRPLMSLEHRYVRPRGERHGSRRGKRSDRGPWMAPPVDAQQKMRGWMWTIYNFVI